MDVQKIRGRNGGVLGLAVSFYGLRGMDGADVLRDNIRTESELPYRLVYN